MTVAFRRVQKKFEKRIISFVMSVYPSVCLSNRMELGPQLVDLLEIVCVCMYIHTKISDSRKKIIYIIFFSNLYIIYYYI